MFFKTVQGCPGRSEKCIHLVALQESFTLTYIIFLSVRTVLACFYYFIEDTLIDGLEEYMHNNEIFFF